MRFPRKRTVILLCAALALLWLGWCVFSTFALDYASEHYLANGVVRVELPNGRKFNIPERYMFSQGFLVHGRWPKPKEGRVKVDYFKLDALLPDLRPFREEDRAMWEALGIGSKIHGSVHSVGQGSKFHDPESWEVFYQDMLKSVDGVHVEILPDVGKLKAFVNSGGVGKNIKPRSIDYISGDFTTTLNCYISNDTPFPECNVMHLWKNGVVIDYSYSLNYFDSWEGINTRLVDLVARFERVAAADKEGKGAE
ncbi:hypothetical protein [Ciceribacter sp. RN22]|uniref:hypothetical protein n=1 Tax=Ciceribacter sp. RN22 TaxID=2954932 RepID=UPI002093F05F|nr:hypothetical protein [Ciceribacter sp. RN22]MCO6181038.1 hypothetical protein [Ciceribacter sp. RN22]